MTQDESIMIGRIHGPILEKCHESIAYTRMLILAEDPNPADYTRPRHCVQRLHGQSRLQLFYSAVIAHCITGHV